MLFLPNRWQLGFFERSVTSFKRNGATFKHKGQLSCFERNVTSLKDTVHILTQYVFLLFKLNCLFCFEIRLQL